MLKQMKLGRIISLLYFYKYNGVSLIKKVHQLAGLTEQKNFSQLVGN